MIKMRKRVVAMLTAMVMLCATMVVDVSATTTNTMTGSLDLSTTATSTLGDGWTWTYDASGSTLEITSEGLTINSDSNGIILPAGSKLIINGELNITAGENGIITSSSGDLSIVVNAPTTITSEENGIGYINGALNMDVNSDMTITSSSGDGICVSNSNGSLILDIDYNVTMKVAGDWDNGSAIALFANMQIVAAKITVNGTLDASGNRGIYADTKVELYGSGTINITNNGRDSIVAMNGAIAIGNDASTFTLNTGGYILANSDYNDVSVGSNVTCNAFIRYNDAGGTDNVIGDFTPSGSNTFPGKSTTLNLTENSNLTINEGITADLSDYTTIIIDSNATIVNDGVLIFPASMDNNITWTSISGSGIVKVAKAANSAEFACYDNDGNFLYMEETAKLGEADVTTNEYTWTKGDDGVYTLEILGDIIHGDIEIEVENAIIKLNENATVGNIEVSYNDGDDPAYLTISGDYTLHAGEVEVEGSLTIEEGTTLEAILIGIGCFNDGSWSELIVNGTLNTKVLFIVQGDLTVTNTGVVLVTYDEEILNAAPANVMLVGPGKEPVVTLGEEVKIITPEGGYYEATKLDSVYTADNDNSDEDSSAIYYGYFFTKDGVYAQDLYIGPKPFYDIGVIVTGEGTVSPEGNIFSVMEGLDKEFQFTPADGYKVADVKIDGESQGAISSYTFENVTLGHTLEVEFVVDDTPTGDDSSDESGIIKVGDSTQTGDDTSLLPLATLIIAFLGIAVILARKSSF